MVCASVCSCSVYLTCCISGVRGVTRVAFPSVRSMEAALTRLKSLSADELREEILKANLKCGPITATTRGVFERKLARALAENAGLSGTPGEDADVGYHLGLNPPEEEPLSEQSVSAARHDVQTASRPAQAEPSVYFGVCPLWDDVLARNGEVSHQAP